MPTANQKAQQAKPVQKPVQPEQAIEPENPDLEVADVSQMFQAVHEATEQTKAALVTEQTAALQSFVGSLEHAEQRRDELVDNLSDRLVRLHHSGCFVHDVLMSTQRKLQASYAQNPLQTQATTAAINSLVEVFDVVAQVENSSRSIAPHSLMGAVPL